MLLRIDWITGGYSLPRQRFCRLAESRITGDYVKGTLERLDLVGNRSLQEHCRCLENRYSDSVSDEQPLSNLGRASMYRRLC